MQSQAKEALGRGRQQGRAGRAAVVGNCLIWAAEGGTGGLEAP